MFRHKVGYNNEGDLFSEDFSWINPQYIVSVNVVRKKFVKVECINESENRHIVLDNSYLSVRDANGYEYGANVLEMDKIIDSRNNY